jgi:hypothetical protein
MVRCIVLVKINGNSPRKSLNRINENSEININVLPLILSPAMINLRLFMINSWITVHFGKNPINGGKPPVFALR